MLLKWKNCDVFNIIKIHKKAHTIWAFGFSMKEISVKANGQQNHKKVYIKFSQLEWLKHEQKLCSKISSIIHLSGSVSIWSQPLNLVHNEMGLEPFENNTKCDAIIIQNFPCIITSRNWYKWLNSTKSRIKCFCLLRKMRDA